MSVLRVLNEQHGCARSRDLLLDGPRRRELRALLATGEVRRVQRGLYASAGAPAAVVAAATVGGSVTCLSAARLVGLPLLARSEQPHVAVPAHRASPRSGLLPSGSVVHWGLEPRTVGQFAPIAVALVHALRCLPFREVVALADAALARDLLRPRDLLTARPRFGGLQVDRLVRHADGRSQSLPESLLRLALRGAGLSVVPQALIDGVGRVDLLVERCVVVEVDGFAYHAGRREFVEDRRRDRVTRLLGLTSLRFTYDDVVLDAARCASEVSAVVDHHRATRTPR